MKMLEFIKIKILKCIILCTMYYYGLRLYAAGNNIVMYNDACNITGVIAIELIGVMM